MSELTTTPEAQIVADLARSASKPVALEDLGATLVRHGETATIVQHERVQATPAAKRGNANVGTVDDLLAYTAAHKTDGTTLWVPGEDNPTGSLVAVLDDHHAEPGWGSHRVQHDLRHSPEWLIWTRASGSMMGQVEFAEFLEENALDIEDPSPATLLEVATTFQANTSTAFESAVRLDSGNVQVKFEETGRAQAGKYGAVEIPKTFSILVAPYVGEAAYRMTARLRHRASGGKLTLGFILDRPHVVLRDALGKIADRVRDAGHGPTYIGNPISTANRGPQSPHTENLGPSRY